MTEPQSPPSAAAVRSSALALLSSGNSLESVAQVFGIPVETLQSWTAHPTQVPPPQGDTAPEPGPAAAWITFPGTATYSPGTMACYVGSALAPLLLAGPVLAWPFVFDGSRGGLGALILLVATLACLATAACAIRYVTHSRFELTPRAITAYRLGAGVSLPLARVEALTATRQPRSMSYTVVLHAKDGARSLKIYPEDRHLRDDDLFAWLTSIPQRGGDAIRRKAVVDSSTGSRAMPILMGGFTLVLVGFLASAPIAAARNLASGDAPLDRLSLVDGTLTSLGRCHPGGRRYSASLPITLVAGGVTVNESVGCDLASALRAPDGDHHVSVWRDKRPFADGQVREVDMDGRVLQSYASYIARDRRFAPFILLGELMMLSTIVLVGLGFVVSDRGD